MDLKMDNSGNNRNWRAHIQKGREDARGTEITNIYGMGEWRLMYPTSIHVRQNMFHICNYYVAHFHMFDFMILSRDIINVIGDFTLGIGVRSLDMIEMQLILQKESFRSTKRDWSNRSYTFRGYDEGEDFCEKFGFSISNQMVDLLSFCIDEVENKEENKLEDYENIMKLEQFTDDEEDEQCDRYFKGGGNIL